MRQSFSEYSTLDIARYVIQYAFDDTEPVTNLALQKILYFMQYSSLVLLKTPLNSKIEFEAWKHGPVVREVYSHYRINGGCLIMPDADDSLEDDLYQEMKTHFHRLNSYVSKWLRFNPWKLVDISHEKGGAWDIAFHKGVNTVITSEMMLGHDLKKQLGLSDGL